MKKHKKIGGAFISVVLLFVLCVSTVAAKDLEYLDQMNILSENDIYMLVDSIDLEQEYVRAKMGLSDIPVTEEMIDLCQASITDENGNTEYLSTVGTIKKLGCIQRSKKVCDVYTLTVFSSDTKTDSGSAQKNGTTAYGSLTWIDNFGIENELVSVSGGWTPGYGEQLLDRSVTYGADNDSAKSALKYPSSNSFSYNGTSKMVGLLMYANIDVKVNGNSLNLRVVGSIFS